MTRRFELWARRAGAAGCATALTLAVAPVLADEKNPEAPSSRWTSRPIALMGNVGAGTPYGLAGVALDWSPLDYLSVAVGSGFSSSGLQSALMPRARLPFGAGFGVGLEAGLSGGRYKIPCRFGVGCDEVTHGAWAFVLWLNTGPFAEWRSSGGFSLRLFGGIAWFLHGWSGNCINNKTGQTEPSPCPRDSLAYVGLAAGYAF